MADTMLTDEELQAKVLDELRWNPEVKPTDVGIEVDDGVVTLTGTVESYPMKVAAEKAAHRVRGVRAVANDIHVTLPFERTRSDTEIAAAAAHALGWNTQIPVERVNLTVRVGWITLDGEVDWAYQKESAEMAVRNLTGVRGVTNILHIASTFTMAPQEVRFMIEEALKRNAELDAQRIRVETADGKVILSGTVRSWAERQEAEYAAWAAEGVSDVENRITVSV